MLARPVTRPALNIEDEGGDARRLGCGLHDLDPAPTKPPASGLG
jgi:hypothetical protein